MRAEKAIHALLAQAVAVTAIVGDRIYSHTLLQGEPLPALVVEHVSTVQLSTLDAAAEFGLMQSRIQVTGLAGAYPALKDLLEQVRIACNYQRGLIAGVRVNSVVRDVVGPDFSDDDRTVFHQSIDFIVTFQEP